LKFISKAVSFIMEGRQATVMNRTLVAALAKPLYDSLDESQKHKFGMLGRMLMPERSKFAMDMMHQHMGEPDRDGAG
jgi:hypothetical protein